MAQASPSRYKVGRHPEPIVISLEVRDMGSGPLFFAWPKNTWLCLGGSFNPKKLEFFHQKSFLTGRGTTLHLIIHFYVEIFLQQMTPETPDKNPMPMVPRPRNNSHRTSHLLPIWSSQISHHLLPAGLRCEIPPPTPLAPTLATPDLCDKANGSSSRNR